MAFQYIVFYKPYRVLTQFSSDGDKQTLADYIKDIPKDIYPVGRLDYESEGLLILTNDKSVNHQLTEPKFAHQRTYLVQVDGDITDDALKQLSEGVTIKVNGKPYHTKTAIVKKLKQAPDVPERNPPIRFRANIPAPWISLTLTEGKNRQVRKMTAAVGFPTLRLIRTNIDKLEIGKMLPGDYQFIGSNIKKLLNLR